MLRREHQIGCNGRLWEGTKPIPPGTYNTLTDIYPDNGPRVLVLTNLRGEDRTVDPERVLLHLEHKGGACSIQDKLCKKEELVGDEWQELNYQPKGEKIQSKALERMLQSLANRTYRDIYPFKPMSINRNDPTGSDPFIFIPGGRLTIEHQLFGFVVDTKNPYRRYYGYTAAIPKKPEFMIDDPVTRALYFVHQNTQGQRVVTRIIYGIPAGRKYIYQQEGLSYILDTSATFTGPT